MHCSDAHYNFKGVFKLRTDCCVLTYCNLHSKSRSGKSLDQGRDVQSKNIQLNVTKHQVKDTIVKRSVLSLNMF